MFLSRSPSIDNTQYREISLPNKCIELHPLWLSHATMILYQSGCALVYTSAKAVYLTDWMTALYTGVHQTWAWLGNVSSFNLNMGNHRTYGWTSSTQKPSSSWPVTKIYIQWNLYIMDNIWCRSFLSIIRKWPLLGGFIIAWVWLITKIHDVIWPMTSQAKNMAV